MTQDSSPPEPPLDPEPPPSPAGGSDAFFAQVYDELRAIAHSRMRREQVGKTLQSTELVHEAYLRLSDRKDAAWENRSHFFAAAAEAMRRILIERARARGRVKRGGDSGGKPAPKVPLDLEEVAQLADDRDPEAILALDRTIELLARLDERAAQVVRLRFYAGLSVDEVAETLDVSRRTILREWGFARVWLYKQMAAGSGGEVPPGPREESCARAALTAQTRRPGCPGVRLLAQLVRESSARPKGRQLAEGAHVLDRGFESEDSSPLPFSLPVFVLPDEYARRDGIQKRA